MRVRTLISFWGLALEAGGIARSGPALTRQSREVGPNLVPRQVKEMCVLTLFNKPELRQAAKRDVAIPVNWRVMR